MSPASESAVTQLVRRLLAEAARMREAGEVGRLTLTVNVGPKGIGDGCTIGREQHTSLAVLLRDGERA